MFNKQHMGDNDTEISICTSKQTTLNNMTGKNSADLIINQNFFNEPQVCIKMKSNDNLKLAPNIQKSSQ